jgi:hypothetical protein
VKTASAIFATVAIWNLAATAWQQVANNLAVELAVLAAGVTGAGILWIRAIHPAFRGIRRARALLEATWSAVKPLSENAARDAAWQAQVNEWRFDCDRRFELIETALHERLKDMVAENKVLWKATTSGHDLTDGDDE